ncbi:MAG: hypothetical protein E7004_03090 [Alphaproteobacteria bacterium]|nr:hypothetical protein [Alphaproteobacteria bacterium]
MSIEKILVDNYTFSLTKDGWLISLEMGDDNVKDAFLSYDGRNCAILTVNNEKAYLLTNISLNIRDELNKMDKVIIIHLDNGEIANGYEVDIKHVEEVPYPDTFVDDMLTVLDEIKNEVSIEKFEEIIDNLVAYNEKMQKDLYALKA